MLWAAAVLDASAPAALTRLRELAAALDASQLDASTLQHMFQAHMALDRGAGGSGGESAPLLPSEVLREAKAAWQARPPSTAAPEVHIVSC